MRLCGSFWWLYHSPNPFLPGQVEAASPAVTGQPLPARTAGNDARVVDGQRLAGAGKVVQGGGTGVRATGEFMAGCDVNHRMS